MLQDSPSNFWFAVDAFVPYLLLVFELATVCGFIAVFHFLFKELKQILAHERYQKIKYKTATYLALISILNSARFFYYGVICLTFMVIKNVDLALDCYDLIPSYVTELAFCFFVIFHFFVETNNKQREVQARVGDPSSPSLLKSET